MTIHDTRSARVHARGAVTEGDLMALFQRAADAHAALMAGEVARYLDVVDPAPDLLIMTPVGGHTQRDAPFSEAEAEDMRRFFRKGSEGRSELLGAYASGDLAVLVMIERARAEVADVPEQDWALRVTLAFRRDATGWRLVHRHADPLVARSTWARVAEFARA